MDTPVFADPQRLTIDVTEHPGGTVVHVLGELDHDTTEELQEALGQVLERRGGGHLVIDCAAIAFCDSSGLNTLLRTRHRAHEQQRPLTLAAPSRAMLRLLQITGADAALDTTPTVAEALTTL
ncbi:STAS domain-containing protein [Streptacidiphilus neutrinimicus]|uniref:STAS domain-containing protein n=1 Tax=Streptacidiphilus neutrinimicus TaxID=105420 RepID=UPI0005A6FAEA|nr:STAS domain-containing protein [Streptacidiphilus neutrinimicus]